jgi:hypothetical protein
MSNKRNATTIAIASTAIVLFVLLSILRYDEPSFHQSNLDEARKQLRSINNEYECAIGNILQITQADLQYHPDSKRLNALSKIYKSNPEVFQYLEPQMDSLAKRKLYLQDSIANVYFNQRKERINKIKSNRAIARNKVNKLEQDSIITDSVRNMPQLSRFKNNFCNIFLTKEK